MKHQRITVKPRKIKDPQTFIRKFNDYLSFAEEHDQIPFRAGFCLFLGINESTMDEWKKIPEYKEAYGLMKTALHQVLINGGFKGEYKEKLVSLTLRNHYGYKETDDDTNAENKAPQTISIVLAEPKETK